MRPEELKAYELIEKKEIADIHSQSLLLRHRKTGARVALLENNDENKVFYIGFRTPPVDSTGSAHIVEHTVLCGSREFPLKDPFIELAKGSLNTFLNAMTYPDKTVYPVASCNDKDFQNLMHVYLDAVFYPNIYREEKIFRQEGWHYEMEQEDSPLTLSGVVYSEMKGAFSSPDDVLDRYIMNSLFPDTPYGFESGGDPEVIPSLTYEKFLDFHKRYYHPSNSYIYLYGNMDMAEKLDFIDKKYLSRFENLQVDSELTLQKPFAKMQETKVKYPVSEEESEEGNTYLSVTKAVETSLDTERSIAFQVLDYCLCSAPGAPLKQALIDAGIGKDVYSVYDDGIRQPYFSVIAKDAEESQKEEFLKICHNILQEQVSHGINKKALLAALNHFEFKYREADFGSYPKGLMYGLQMLDSWLYDENKPFIHLEAAEAFAVLRNKAEEGYFEKLIETELLNNSFGSIVILIPEKGLAAKREKELADKLQQYKKELSDTEVKQIVTETKQLKEYQETPDTPEALASIPHLTREDLKKEAFLPINDLRYAAKTEVLFHEIVTNGIGYLRLMFDCTHVPEDLFPYIGLMKNMIGLMNTEHYTYADLFNEINLKTGGMTSTISSFTDIRTPDKYRITFDLKTKILYHQLPDAFELMQEMILGTKWNDPKRLRELMEESRSRAQSEMLSAGHVIAVQRAFSHLSESAAAGEILNGITQFRLIEDITDHFEEQKETLANKMEQLIRLIFRPENLMIDYTAEKEGYQKLPELTQALCQTLEVNSQNNLSDKFHPCVIKKNEGFTSASQVQYVARVGNFRKKGLPFHGALRVLKMMLGYDYLWNNVRVKGGAYGCMCGFSRTGDSYLASYRDPHIGRTLDVYEKTAAYIRDFKDGAENEEKLTQYIIGAIGEADTPKTPQGKGNFSLDCFLSEISPDILQKEREEILYVTPQVIRSLSNYLDAVLQDQCFCALGGEEKVKEHAELFDETEPLFH